mmetsp:Transcript_6488/g.17929  ORF Transcript_6488/g.17929 Transcript_6488/m.17929 type:complete len:253 (+) Transcript_6488:1388-2146(+)
MGMFALRWVCPSLATSLASLMPIVSGGAAVFVVSGVMRGIFRYSAAAALWRRHSATTALQAVSLPQLATYLFSKIPSLQHKYVVGFRLPSLKCSLMYSVRGPTIRYGCLDTNAVGYATTSAARIPRPWRTRIVSFTRPNVIDNICGALKMISRAVCAPSAPQNSARRVIAAFIVSTSALKIPSWCTSKFAASFGEHPSASTIRLTLGMSVVRQSSSTSGCLARNLRATSVPLSSPRIRCSAFNVLWISNLRR